MVQVEDSLPVEKRMYAFVPNIATQTAYNLSGNRFLGIGPKGALEKAFGDRIKADFVHKIADTQNLSAVHVAHTDHREYLGVLILKR